MISDAVLIAALILGPVFAAGLVLWRTETDRRQQRRLAVFHALLQNRRRWLSPEWISAVNLTLVEFARHPEIIAACEALFDKFADAAWTATDQRRQRVVFDTETAVCALLQKVAEAVDVPLKASDLRNRNYAPIGWTLEDVQGLHMRELATQILQGRRTLRVELAPSPAAASAPPREAEAEPALAPEQARILAE